MPLASLCLTTDRPLVSTTVEDGDEKGRRGGVDATQDKDDDENERMDMRCGLDGR